MDLIKESTFKECRMFSLLENPASSSSSIMPERMLIFANWELVLSKLFIWTIKLIDCRSVSAHLWVISKTNPSTSLLGIPWIYRPGNFTRKWFDLDIVYLNTSFFCKKAPWPPLRFMRCWLFRTSASPSLIIIKKTHHLELFLFYLRLLLNVPRQRIRQHQHLLESKVWMLTYNWCPGNKCETYCTYATGFHLFRISLRILKELFLNAS